MEIKKGIQVKVIAGKDKGKTGEILEINRKLNKIKVKSINIIKRHLKPTKENKGGIISKESFIHLSNVKNINYLNLRPSRIENYFFFESSIFDPPLRIQKKYDLDENLEEFLEWEKDQINENKEFRKFTFHN